METLVVAQHKNHYYDRTRGQATTAVRFGSFGSPPSVGFKEINCRSFESGVGILPTPLMSCSSTPVSKKAEGSKKSKRSAPSSAISIPIEIKVGDDMRKVESLNDEFAYSELWAGPAYSNSPPPSSLPIPKFSVKPKRTVSLDLPSSPSDIDLPPFAKSAPASPTRERSPSPGVLSDDSTDSATQTLRRILNLEIMD